MPSKFHKLIANALIELGEDLTKSKKWKTRFTEVFDGNRIPLKIINPFTRRVMGWNYYPDVYYTTTREKKFIFEVIDTESVNELIADYVQTVLLHAHATIFITTPERLSEVKDIIETIKDILKEDLRIKKRPYWDVISIDVKRFKDVELIKKELNSYLEKYWYTPYPIKPED